MKLVRLGAVASLLASVIIAVPTGSGHADAAAPSTTPGTYTALTPTRLYDSRQSFGVLGGDSRNIQVLGRAGVPATGVSAVVVNVTATRAQSAGYLSTSDSYLPTHATSTLNYAPGTDVANVAVVRLDPRSDSINVYNGEAGGARVDFVVDVEGWYADGRPVEPGAFAPVAPARLLDTRYGQGSLPGPVKSGGTVPLAVTGLHDVPGAASVAAVLLNVTATGATSSGHVSVHPGGTRTPATSNLNYRPGRATANLVTAAVGADGVVQLTVGGGPVHLVADVLGYIRSGNTRAAGSENIDTPERIVDTRTGVGVAAGKVLPGATLSVPLGGRGGVPSSGVAAVVVTVTATQATSGGHVTAFADGSAVPATSNLNFSAGQDVANTVIVPVGANVKVDLLNGSAGGSVHLVVDVSGWIRSTPPADASPAMQPTGVFANLGETRLDAGTANDLRLRWTSGTVTGDLRNHEGHRLAVVGNVVYTVTSAGLSATDVVTGKVLWTHPSRNGVITVGAAVYTAENTDNNGEYQLAALDKADGHTLWTTTVRGGTGVYDNLEVVSGRLVYATEDGGDSRRLVLLSVDASTGAAPRSTIIDTSLDRSYGYGYADGRVFVAGSDTGLRAFDLVSGTALWSDPLAPQGAVRGVGGRLYLNSFGVVASYDPAGCGTPTCRPAWITTLPPSATENPRAFSQAAITANTITFEGQGDFPGYVTSIYAYSTVTGQLLSQAVLPAGTSPQAQIVTPGLLWLVVGNDVVVVPDSCSGTCPLLKRYTGLDVVQPRLEVGGGTVLVLSAAGPGPLIQTLR